MRMLIPCSLLAILSARLLAVDIGATTQPNNTGPSTVMLGELANLYEPVPFDHKTHAEMAEMWEGCITCHHRPPTTQPIGQPVINPHDQADSDKIPACKSCHAIAPEQVDMHMPSLKGAYHRQCLNCHREWANENSCTACHRPRNGITPAPPPTPDDIVGRMHPPIPQPDAKLYVARYTPAVGPNVLFRHIEHSTKYGLKCVNCHRHDTCSSCHNGNSRGPQLLHPGETWDKTHGPCIGCHQQDRCRTCHFDDGESPPAPFEHRMIGQLLDDDHSSLKCGQCHSVLKARKIVTCGDASCHKPDLAITYPTHRPGPLVKAAPTTMPSDRPIVRVELEPSGSVVKRVRRAQGGGS